MNIFILDIEPSKCAEYHCDKHVVKMVLESAQLLSTAAHLMGKHKPEMYKPTHINHPCTQWAAADMSHYRWLHLLFIHLMREYTYRYGKEHACNRIQSALRIWPKQKLYSLPDTFALAMPDMYKQACPVAAYRAYYLGAKAGLATWAKGRAAPAWWQPC